MKFIVQRVLEASVKVDGEKVASIDHGLMVLAGITQTDNQDILKWMTNKLVNLRIFPDSEGKMNKSVKDVSGSILIVPNFTLYGKLKKGFRPSYSDAAGPELSKPMFDDLVNTLKSTNDIKIESGIFGADMKVSLINDGPVTVEIKKEADV